MPTPYFYIASLKSPGESFVLNENSSRHVVQVLRMQVGENLRLTDGKGGMVLASISEAHKKHCRVTVIEKNVEEPSPRRVRIALSLLKNANRFEWFLEKATELGIAEIIPLKCTRTEKQQFRTERMRGILESALIQSQQVWLPVLHEPVNFDQYISQEQSDQKFIAHCEPGTKSRLSEIIQTSLKSQLILIGPEGDFTPDEIRLAIERNFMPVTLGDNRLRSETAAVAAAAVLKLIL